MPDRVRVRYAPSPTGEPHIGNIRTALFNWLFARHGGGQFILRIEDTDRERLVPGALEAILEGLRWLGLDWDEGPEVGGPYGPYIQSERLALYLQAAQKLLAVGSAYYCYCTPERLDAMRKEQVQRKEPPGYDRRCRYLTAKEREARELEGHGRVVRFMVPMEGITTFHDLVREEVSWESKLLDDFVVLKSDGFPTYHLASVVDDHAMEITHVMRAEEWLPSTPRHILIYDALGYKPPLFAHLPMILGPDRSKLSKRHGATSIMEYKEKGFLPDAMVNFMALLGWSLDEKTEIIPRDQLVAHFSIQRIVKSAAIFNLEKLTWMNGVYIRQTSPDRLAEALVPFLEKPESRGGLPDSITRPLDRGDVARIVPLIQERLKTLAEGPELTSLFFQENLEYKVDDLLIQKDKDKTLQTLNKVRVRLEGPSSWDRAALEEAIRPMAEELGLKTGHLFGAIRVAVTGRSVAPPLFETMEVLGRERCLERLGQALDRLGHGKIQ